MTLFARKEGYLFFAGVSSHWKAAWGVDTPKHTSLSAAVHSAARLTCARHGGCPWDEMICMLAASGGHLEALQYARAQGCPWDEKVSAAAAVGGKLDVLQWCRAQGCPWDSEVCAAAALGGNLEILMWCRSGKLFSKPGTRIFTSMCVPCVSCVCSSRLLNRSFYSPTSTAPSVCADPS